MTGRDDLPREDSLSWSPAEEHSLDDWYDQYDQSDQDADWEAWAEPEPPPPPRPWFRKPGVLIAMIAAASVALVVATVLLLAGDDGSDTVRVPRLTPRPPATTPPNPPITTAFTAPPEARETTPPETTTETTGPAAIGESPDPEPEPEPGAQPEPVAPAESGGAVGVQTKPPQRQPDGEPPAGG